MRHSILCVPVVLGVSLLGCSPPAEEPTTGGYVGMPTGGQTSGGSTSTGGASGSAGTATTGGVAGSGGDGTVGGMAGTVAVGGMSGGAGTGGMGGGASTGPLPTTGCGKDPGQALGEWQVYDVPLTGETL